MGSESIISAVRTFVIDEFLPGEDPSALADDTPLISGGILDSVSRLKLVDFLEQQYAIEIAAHEAHEDHMDTLAQIAELVLSKQARSK